MSVLNRTVSVNPDGSWVLPNIPANFGQVKARATCIQNGVTSFGESDFFQVPANGAVNLPAISMGTVTPIPASLAISPASSTLKTVGQIVQLQVTANYPDGSTKDVSKASTGTNYTISNPAIATISKDGLVRAVTSGALVIQANNDGATGITTVAVILTGSSHGGIPDSWALQYGLNPLDPLMPMEDPDRDGLTNLEEFQKGTDPTNPDTDGDGLNDGDEVHKFGTSPLLADSDGDSIPDGVEIHTDTDPNNPQSYDLKKATATSILTPPSFVLTTSIANPVVSVQLNWKVNLIDGKTTLDLTNDTRTTFSSSDQTICSRGERPGLIFAGTPGNCVISISQNTLTVSVPGTVTSFAPKALSYLPITGFANAAKVSGNYAYVAAGSGGLVVVDVTDRTKPVVANTLPMSANANYLRIVGNTLYLATSAGVTIVDLTNPVSPVIVGSLATPSQVWDLAISGNLVFIADDASGLLVADFTNRAAPVITASMTIPNGVAKGISLSGNYAVVAAGSGAGVVIIDITNPATPRILGSVLTDGDPRKVAVSGTAAFIAQFTLDSSHAATMQVVDFSNPSKPAIVATTPLSLGGKLQDITLSSISGHTFTLGADAYFVNGVPIVDVTQPSNPVPVTILDFSGYRDDNGHGIDADNTYVYMTGEEGTFTDLGTTGDTRLYIGQYSSIVDNNGVAPTVQIATPTDGSALVQGAMATIKVTATDDVAVASVSISIDGQVMSTTTNPPYQYTFTVPGNIMSLIVGATATDYGNNVGVAPNKTFPVIPDPDTTVAGSVIDASNKPVPNVTVTATGGVSSLTGGDGKFAIAKVPTVLDKVSARASFTSTDGTHYGGVSASLPPVVSGTTDVGVITITPIPTITKLSRKSALSGVTVTFEVVGANFTPTTTFAFQPSSSSTVQLVSASPDGSSATVTVASGPGTKGTFALVATTIAGNSDTTVTPVDRFTFVDPASTADTDGDLYPDVIEATYGTDPLDPNSTPVITGPLEAESSEFSILNTQPPAGPASSQEAEGAVVSVLNTQPPAGASSTQHEADATVFSLLNTVVTNGSQAATMEADGVVFSILNVDNSFSFPTAEADSITFCVSNVAPGSAQTDYCQTSTGQLIVKQRRPQTPLDSDGDGYPDDLERALGSDPYNIDSIPDVKYPPEADSTVFGVMNDAQGASAPLPDHGAPPAPISEPLVSNSQVTKGRKQ